MDNDYTINYPTIDEGDDYDEQNILGTPCQLNIIEVPLSYHRQWGPYHPTYVLFDYNGSKHFVRVRKYDTRYFFVDGLKEFRKAHDINDSVIIRFFALDKNTSFEVEVMGPIRGQSRGRSVVTTRRHVFTTNVTQDMVQHNLPLRGYGRRNQWQITIHDGLPSLVKPWFQYLSENNLMPGDEVVFFFRFDEHTWEVLFRKEVIGMTPFPVEDHPT
ncbi:hypothetical protein HKD37_19G053481 [Glycine soja]